MEFYNYYYMCLYIGIYLYHQWTDTAMPGFLQPLNLVVSSGFLLWSAWSAGRIIVDCILLHSKGQMTAGHTRNGILLALLHVLPTVLMSLFMLMEGFA